MSDLEAQLRQELDTANRSINIFIGMCLGNYNLRESRDRAITLGVFLDDLINDMDGAFGG